MDYFELRKMPAPGDNAIINPLPIFFKEKISGNRNLKILDIGCGFGALLLSLKNEGFLNIRGIDSSAPAVEYCRQKNLNVELIELKNFLAKNQEKFDLICANHLIEHLKKEEIIETLKKIRECLAEKGNFYLTVPNAQSATGCYWAYEDFTHQTLFTGGSVYFVLKAAGFSEIELLDIDCLAGLKGWKKISRKILLKIYRNILAGIHKITASSYHRSSPEIFSFEIKAWAKK